MQASCLILGKLRIRRFRGDGLAARMSYRCRTATTVQYARRAEGPLAPSPTPRNRTNASHMEGCSRSSSSTTLKWRGPYVTGFVCLTLAPLTPAAAAAEKGDASREVELLREPAPRSRGITP